MRTPSCRLVLPRPQERRLPRRRARVRSAVSAAVAAGSMVAGFVLLSPAGAGADEITSQIDAIKGQIATTQQQVDALGHRVEAAAEAYDAAQIKLTAATQVAAAAKAAVATAARRVNGLRTQLDGIAAAAYTSASSDSVAQFLLAKSPRDYLDKAGTLDQLARGQADVLSEVTSARHRLAGKKAAADKAAALARHIAAQIAATQASIQGDLATQKTLLISLQGKQQQLEQIEAARVAAAQAAAAQARQAAARAQALAQAQAAQAAQAQAAAAARAAAIQAHYTAPAAVPPPAATPPPPPPPPPPAPAPPTNGGGQSTGRGATAAAYAEAQLGKPYQWGAAGPDSFDCSGLTMAAWASAGVSVDHSTAAQYNEGTHVSEGSLQPGDLVFFDNLGHVGIYIGGGEFIHAPHSGAVVQVASLSGSWYAASYDGATRPG